MKITHLMFGSGGGTERFFMNLTKAMAEKDIQQSFMIRKAAPWAQGLSQYGPVFYGHHGPIHVATRARLRRHCRRFRPDAILAWRAPAARLIKPQHAPVRLCRLGDYPTHLGHFQYLNGLIVNVPTIETHLRQQGWAGPVHLISNFANPTKISPKPRSQFAPSGARFVICAVGRLEHVKGFDILLHALPHLPEAYLWLIGEGAQRAALEQQAHDLGIADRVRFLGWQERPMDFIASADAFVMPSRIEPLGNAMLEAWQSGTPVVTTASEGPSWYARDDHDALIVPHESATAMANALARLLDNPDLGARLSQAATATLAERFSADAVVAAYRQIIESYQEPR
jgi:glycosyltransferase involved in cell wall biosynthesis